MSELETKGIKFEIPKDAEKKRSDTCIVCGYDPNSEEEDIGCYHWHKKVSDKHRYIYYD